MNKQTLTPQANGTSTAASQRDGSSTLTIYIAPDGEDVRGTGAASQPFASLRRATEHLTQLAANPEVALPSVVNFAAMDGAQAREAGHTPPQSKPRFRYFLDPYTQDAKTDGADATPFANVAQATEKILERHSSGADSLRPGQHLALTTRHAFTATVIEGRRQFREKIAKTIFLLMSIILIVPLLAIFEHLIEGAWPSLSLSFVLENPRKSFTAGGVWAPLVGTFYLVILSLLAAAPIGVLAGVYLNEYARDNWFTRIVNLAVVNLAGVPSIVHALFGVGAFVVLTGHPSVLAASLTLAVMTLPVIITSTREALAAVPVSFREACWNMGASRWQTIRTLVLPNSIGGILTGVILQVSRAAGETAPILFTGAVLTKSRLPNTGIGSVFMYGLDDQCMALSYHLYQVASNVPGVPESMQYSAAVVLIGLVLMFNSVSIGLRTYLRSRKKW